MNDVNEVAMVVHILWKAPQRMSLPLEYSIYMGPMLCEFHYSFCVTYTNIPTRHIFLNTRTIFTCRSNRGNLVLKSIRILVPIIRLYKYTIKRSFMQETHSWLNDHLHLNDGGPSKGTKLTKKYKHIFTFI